VVETGGLENRLALTGYGGSNPSPSAKSSSHNFQECYIEHGLMFYSLPWHTTTVVTS
jgi:hypothetical protein